MVALMLACGFPTPSMAMGQTFEDKASFDYFFKHQYANTMSLLLSLNLLTMIFETSWPVLVFYC